MPKFNTERIVNMNTYNDENHRDTITPEVPKQVISREDARALGMMTFFTGKVCVRNHVSERYVSSKNCVACQVAHSAKQVASGEDAAKNKRYRENNPDRWVAKKGWTNAKARGAVIPSDFRSVSDLITATIGFYQEARRLTQETEKPHVVDHIIPLARGGQHHPGNLRVITNALNYAKRNRTDAECLEAIINGTWKGPQDDGTVALLVHSVAADRRMAVKVHA
jgi:hypothetical protein